MAEKIDNEVSTQASEPAGSEGILDQMEKAVPRTSPSDSDEKATETQPAQKPEQKQTEEEKPSKLKQIWQKAGLDPLTLMLMFKGSLPPTIAIAMYQSNAVSSKFGTIGYLVAISSVLGFSIMPRGKFIQNMIINVIAICISTCINLLALFCVTKARQNTTPPGTDPLAPPQFNSTASTVAAIWLIIQTYIINVIRASRPQFMFPAILSSIFVAVSLTYGVTFPDMSYAISFMERLLEAFLTGFALATGVSFFIFPVSSRQVVFKEMTGYVSLLGGCLKCATGFMASLENVDPVQLKEQHQKEMEEAKKAHPHKKVKPPSILQTPALLKLRELHGKLLELHGKIEGDVTPAKREIAIGKLESHDITLIWKHLKQVFLPVMGLMSMVNVLERQAELNRWAETDGTEEEKEHRHHQLDNIHFLLKELHGPFASMVGTIDGALNHVLLTLEFTKPPKQKPGDEESKGDDAPKPGSDGFAAAYRKKVEDFYQSKQQTLRDWCHQHGIDLPADFFDSSFVRPESLTIKDEQARERNQRQLFFTLYLEYLLWRVSASLLDLVDYAEKRKSEGAFKKSKVIFPGSKTIYKWIRSTVGREDLSQEDAYTRNMDPVGSSSVYLGQAFMKKSDPEHLPPRNSVERVGNMIGRFPHFLRSDASMFGLRVVAATFTIGIVCYLRDSQEWFLKQRLLWAMIMVAISMSTTAGQSLWNFVLRIGGTLVAMIAAYIIWYIVDGKTPGVIVFLWFWIFLAYYVVLKFPKLAIVGVLGLVTAILIIGYELQVKAIGVEAATANGQPAYPTYELAPYRLATVVGGLFIALYVLHLHAYDSLKH